MKIVAFVGLLMALVICTSASRADDAVRLFSAGSLRYAMTDIGKAYTRVTGISIVPTFGSSGLLRERIEKGEAADVFTSADFGHPQRLVEHNRALSAVVFARNEMCALAAPGVAVTTNTVLDRMLDPAVKLGTSTPQDDPAGDYAWEVFRKADTLRSGAFQALDKKALKLVGNPDTPQPPPDRSVYSLLITDHKADIILTYCTNALVATREVPGASLVKLPQQLAVSTANGITVLKGAPASADRFALFVLAEPSQRILASYGFTPVSLP